MTWMELFWPIVKYGSAVVCGVTVVVLLIGLIAALVSLVTDR